MALDLARLVVFWRKALAEGGARQLMGREIFLLPDVLCIKMGFSKIRKPQRLQSERR